MPPTPSLCRVRAALDLARRHPLPACQVELLAGALEGLCDHAERQQRQLDEVRAALAGHTHDTVPGPGIGTADGRPIKGPPAVLPPPPPG